MCETEVCAAEPSLGSAKSSYTLSHMFTQFCLFMMAGMREGGRRATPTSISIFDSYGMKTFFYNLVIISLLASKCQGFNVEMSVFQPFYEMKLKISNFKVLAFCSQ